MFSTARRRVVASAALGVAAIGSVALGATPAQAAVTVSPSTGLAATDLVTVSGTVPSWASSANTVAVSVCNVATGVAPGTRCDAVNASSFASVADYGAGIDLTVAKSFSDYDFTAGAGPISAGTTTTCLGSTGSQCAVVVSYYSVAGASVTQVGAEAFNISFS